MQQDGRFPQPWPPLGGSQLGKQQRKPYTKGTVREAWTEQDHASFLEGLRLHGKGSWTKIAEFMGTKTAVQVRSHAQKHYEKLEREKVRGDSGAKWPASNPGTGDEGGSIPVLIRPGLHSVGATFHPQMGSAAVAAAMMMGGAASGGNWAAEAAGSGPAGRDNDSPAATNPLQNMAPQGARPPSMLNQVGAAAGAAAAGQARAQRRSRRDSMTPGAGGQPSSGPQGQLATATAAAAAGGWTGPTHGLNLAPEAIRQALLQTAGTRAGGGGSSSSSDSTDHPFAASVACNVVRTMAPILFAADPNSRPAAEALLVRMQEAAQAAANAIIACADRNIRNKLKDFVPNRPPGIQVGFGQSSGGDTNGGMAAALAPPPPAPGAIGAVMAANAAHNGSTSAALPRPPVLLPGGALGAGSFMPNFQSGSASNRGGTNASGQSMPGAGPNGHLQAGVVDGAANYAPTPPAAGPLAQWAQSQGMLPGLTHAVPHLGLEGAVPILMPFHQGLPGAVGLPFAAASAAPHGFHMGWPPVHGLSALPGPGGLSGPSGLNTGSLTPGGPYNDVGGHNQTQNQAHAHAHAQAHPHSNPQPQPPHGDQNNGGNGGSGQSGGALSGPGLMQSLPQPGRFPAPQQMHAMAPQGLNQAGMPSVGRAGAAGTNMDPANPHAHAHAHAQHQGPQGHQGHRAQVKTDPQGTEAGVPRSNDNGSGGQQGSNPNSNSDPPAAGSGAGQGEGGEAGGQNGSGSGEGQGGNGGGTGAGGTGTMGNTNRGSNDPVRASGHESATWLTVQQLQQQQARGAGAQGKADGSAAAAAGAPNPQAVRVSPASAFKAVSNAPQTLLPALGAGPVAATLSGDADLLALLRGGASSDAGIQRTGDTWQQVLAMFPTGSIHTQDLMGGAAEISTGRDPDLGLGADLANAAQGGQALHQGAAGHTGRGHHTNPSANQARGARGVPVPVGTPAGRQGGAHRGADGDRMMEAESPRMMMPLRQAVQAPAAPSPLQPATGGLQQAAAGAAHGQAGHGVQGPAAAMAAAAANPGSAHQEVREVSREGTARGPSGHTPGSDGTTNGQEVTPKTEDSAVKAFASGGGTRQPPPAFRDSAGGQQRAAAGSGSQAPHGNRIQLAGIQLELPPGAEAAAYDPAQAGALQSMLVEQLQKQVSTQLAAILSQIRTHGGQANPGAAAALAANPAGGNFQSGPQRGNGGKLVSGGGSNRPLTQEGGSDPRGSDPVNQGGSRPTAGAIMPPPSFFGYTTPPTDGARANNGQGAAAATAPAAFEAPAAGAAAAAAAATDGGRSGRHPRGHEERMPLKSRRISPTESTSNEATIEERNTGSASSWVTEPSDAGGPPHARRDRGAHDSERARHRAKEHNAEGLRDRDRERERERERERRGEEGNGNHAGSGEGSNSAGTGNSSRHAGMNEGETEQGLAEDAEGRGPQAQTAAEDAAAPATQDPAGMDDA